MQLLKYSGSESGHNPTEKMIDPLLSTALNASSKQECNYSAIEHSKKHMSPLRYRLFLFSFFTKS